MPSGTYHVAQCEESQFEGNDVPSDQANPKKINDRSFKNCRIFLLAFALLVILIIAISWPFGRASHQGAAEDLSNATEQYRGSPVPSIATTNADVEVISSVTPGAAKNSSRLEYRDFPTETTSSGFTIDSETTETQSSDSPSPPGDDFTSSTTEDNRSPETTTDDQSNSPIWKPLFPHFLTTTERYQEQSTPPPEEPTTAASEFDFEGLYSTTDVSASSNPQGSSTEIDFQTPSDSSPRTPAVATSPDTEDFTSLKRLLVASYFGNDSSSTEDPSNDNWLDNLDEKVSTQGLTSSEAQRDFDTTTSSTGEPQDTTDQPRELSRQESRRMDRLEPVDEAFTGKSRQEFSKILSWMNHSADPCEDFYEYSCGGLEADPEMIIVDAEQRALAIIKKQMMKEEEQQSRFYEYYKTCVDYKKNESEKLSKFIEKAMKVHKEMREKVEEGKEQSYLMLILYLFMTSHRSFLLDITPDVDDSDPQKFILSIGPSLPSPLPSIFRNNSCDPSNTEEGTVDLDEMYENYRSCRNNTSELVDASMEISNGDLPLDFIRSLLSDFPSENEIREAHRSRNYTVLTVGDLVKQSTYVNYSQLLTISHDTKIQVYFKDNLFRIMRKIDDYGLYNSSQLLAVVSGIVHGSLFDWMKKANFSQDWEADCLRIATKVLPSHASKLYMSSFTEDELNTLQSKVSDIFNELKRTLRSKFEGIDWVSNEGREYLLKKLDAIKISLPQVSYFEEINRAPLIDDIFPSDWSYIAKEESYGILNNSPHDPKSLWRSFATAFQPLPRALHALNTILVPLGALGPLKSVEKTGKYNYATLSSVGTLLAHEISSYFDVNGIQYWNDTRHSDFPILDDSNFTMIHYQNYITCQRDEIFRYPIEIIIPGTNQLVKLKIPPHTLNERLSDAAGVRLAHDTLDRLGLNQVKPIPWFDLNADQLFYITWAQTHCTKAPLTASSISLHEDPQLPGRLRVYAAAMSNRRIGEVFKCAEGSQLLTPFSCGVFPYLEVPIPAAR
ncbi:neprilysin-2-like [Diachasmimorpha longicaudata]|uniref:neprilysin-2-like n=1 Tax=Diachasmimorpha longicaudata TaxID=58733 RepID=UPI0030B8F440